MTIRIKKQSPAGLYLWYVIIYPPPESFREAPKYLWITTRRDDIATAVSKARDFIDANPAWYKGWTVQKVKEYGTIDA